MNTGSGCIAALEAEKFLAEEEAGEGEETAVKTEVGHSRIEPAVAEQDAQSAAQKKDNAPATAEYKQNPLL